MGKDQEHEDGEGTAFSACAPFDDTQRTLPSETYTVKDRHCEKYTCSDQNLADP